jgi:hypothetical protein
VQSAYLGSTLVYSASTTTTSTTTTTTSTTSTTTTTANPIPSGAFAFYDFGNATSYPGSGSSVFDLSGNSRTATLRNTPTYSSTNGGIMQFQQASSQYMDYQGYMMNDITTIVIWKNTDATFQKYSGYPTDRSNYGLVWTNDVGSAPQNKQFVPILFNNTGGGTTYSSTYIGPADIQTFHQYSVTVKSNSSISTTAKTYLDDGTTTFSQTANQNRTGTPSTTDRTIYLNRDTAVGDRYGNGYMMAYLHYNRELSASEIASIYSYFAGRFTTTTTTTTAAPTTTTTAAPTTTTTTTAAPTTTTTTAASTTTTTAFAPQYFNVRECGTSNPTTALGIVSSIPLSVGMAVRPRTLNGDIIPEYGTFCYELISTTTSGLIVGQAAPAASCAQSVCTTTTTTAAPTTTTTTTAATTTTTTAGTTTTTTAGISPITASLDGAVAGTFTSGGFTWNYLDLYSAGGSTLNKTLNVTSGYQTDVKLLLIGGGGGGAYSSGGGSYGNGGAGGAGQVVYADAITLSSGSYAITVAAGGAGGDYTARTQGSNGGTSTALGYTANGGGGGGGASPNGNGRSVSGGSGGGAGESGTGGSGTYNGGSNSGATGGGGGGGASANGTNGGAGIGGAGLTFNLTGTDIEVGGGGNGGTSAVGGGNAGSYGGGRGSRSGQSAQNGTNATGGGAGGGSTGGSSTGSGGSGRFILAWKSI